jgi:adenylate cyclase
VNRASSARIRWLAAALLTLAAWLAGVALGSTLLGRSLDDKAYDAIVTAHPAAPPANIVLVLVDEESRRRIREPLAFWQAHYARLIRAAAEAGSRAIAVDLIFALEEEYAPPGGYQDLAQAILEASGKGVPVVLGYDRDSDLPAPRVYLLARSTGSLGYLNLPAEPDETIRRYTFCHRAGDEVQTSLGALVAALAERSPVTCGPPGGGDARRLAPPAPGTASLLVYRGPPLSFRHVSFARVLDHIKADDQKALQELFAGATVFLGSDDIQDRHATPFRASGRHPGVEIHATAAAMVQESRWGREVPQSRVLSLAFVAVLACVALCLRLPWHAGAAAFLVLLASPAVAAYLLWSGLHWLRPAPAMLGVLVAYVSVNAYRYQTEFKARDRLRRHFAQYVSPEVVKQIVERGGVALEGRQQRVTVLFSDIRGFTTLSEGSEPVALVRQLNEYLSAMTEVILRHGGMVDKFIGDGILALFGAPLEDDRAAARAARAALAMVARLEALNRSWEAQGRPRLQIGIGLHSGVAVVGNVGSDLKREYTAIGDTVNTASRVEARTKESIERFAVPILISEETRSELQRLGLAADTAFMSEDTLKGKSQATRLYLLRGLGGEMGGKA